MSRSKCPTRSAVCSTRPVADAHAERDMRPRRRPNPTLRVSGGRTVSTMSSAVPPWRAAPPRGDAQQPRAGSPPGPADPRASGRGAVGLSGAVARLGDAEPVCGADAGRAGQPLEPPARGGRGRPRRRHVVLSTGTASGKSLDYLLPALSDVVDGSLAPNGRGATALYLAPTRPSRTTSSTASTGSPCRSCGPRPTTATPRPRTGVGPGARQLRPHQPGPAPPLPPTGSRSLGAVPPGAPVRRRRRVPRLPGRLRVPPRDGAAPAAARVRAVPVHAHLRARLGDGGRPAVHAGRLVGMPVQAVTEDGSPRAAHLRAVARRDGRSRTFPRQGSRPTLPTKAPRP